jgi:hypothetical protein
MQRAKAVFISVVVLGLALVVVRQYQQVMGLLAENAALRDQAQQLMSRPHETEPRPTPRPLGDQVPRQDPSQEVLRLRGEVATLKRELADALKKQVTALSSPDGPERGKVSLAAIEHFNEEGAAKGKFAKEWMAAFIAFATENQGQFPTNFWQAEGFLSDSARNQTNVTIDQFEIVYQGSQNDLTNQGDEDIIVLRERQAWQSYDGKWGRTYGRVDGSALRRFMKDLDSLEQWEREHLRTSAP